MTEAYVVLPNEDATDTHARFRADVRRGLHETPKCIPSLYFYDEMGSKLWDQITMVPEYYVTVVEEAIIHENAKRLSALVGDDPTDIVELGSGCGGKTWAVLDQMVADRRDVVYRPADISEAAMENMACKVQSKYGGRIPMSGVVADYVHSLAYLNHTSNGNGRKKLVLFFGSNIGNLGPEEEREFLLKLRSSMTYQDRLVIGFDLMKDLGVLRRAYNDSLGVTRQFNMNLLTRMNRELKADFYHPNFVHHPFYDPSLRAMVSWLVAARSHTVTFKEADQEWQVDFREGEGIRLEMSRKYTRAGIRELAARTRFRQTEAYTDSRRYFIDSVWAPA